MAEHEEYIRELEEAEEDKLRYIEYLEASQKDFALKWKNLAKKSKKDWDQGNKEII